jgi:hypothetical protein
MAGGCMGSTSTGTTGTGNATTGTASFAGIGFGGTAIAGYGMYGGASAAGYGYGGSGYNNSVGYNSNGSNGGNLNSAIATAATGGNAALARFNPQQAQNPPAAAADVPDSVPLELPSRSWTDGDGNVAVEGQFVGVLDHKVIVRKAGGRISLVALDQLSDTDRQYVSSVAGHKAMPAVTPSE